MKDTPAWPGFTLIELLAVVALLAIITGVLTLIASQLFSVPLQGNAQMNVDNDLRLTSLWITQDGNQAWRFTPGSAPIYGTFAITRTDTSTATVTYRYDSGALWRDVQSGGNTDTARIARHIAQQNDVIFTTRDAWVTVGITATSGTGNNQIAGHQVFTVTMRVE